MQTSSSYYMSYLQNNCIVLLNTLYTGVQKSETTNGKSFYLAFSDLMRFFFIANDIASIKMGIR